MLRAHDVALAKSKVITDSDANPDCIVVAEDATRYRTANNCVRIADVRIADATGNFHFYP